MQASEKRLRVLIYLQHLAGVGHFIRMSEIAKALAMKHDVMLCDGGRPTPRQSLDAVRVLTLPRVGRSGGSDLVALDDAGPLEKVMEARRRRLQSALAEFRPNVVLVEAYPFSKWILETEIQAMLEAAKSENPSVKIVCSIRDLEPRSRHEISGEEDYARFVKARLERHFDALFVQGDPTLWRLEARFPLLSDISLPVVYTGIVSESFSTEMDADRALSPARPPYILVSVGGGKDSAQLLSGAFEAFKILRAGSKLNRWKLVMRQGVDGGGEALPEEIARFGDAIEVKGFGVGFLAELKGAAVSVSAAGYNTCANLLSTRTRAVLVPKPEMPDQLARSSLFAAHGLARVVPAPLDAAALAEAILLSSASEPPQHDIDLDGARRSCSLIEALVHDGLYPQS
ncbi:MAG: glycosyltransferase [Methylocystis sp.]